MKQKITNLATNVYFSKTFILLTGVFGYQLVLDFAKIPSFKLRVFKKKEIESLYICTLKASSGTFACV